MTRDEFKTIVKAMKAIYTDEKFIPDQFSFDLWFNLLGNVDYQVCQDAVQRYIMSNHWPPMPSDIIEAIYKNVVNTQDWGAAWESVMSAIRKYGYTQESKALESLEPLARQVVQRIGFQNLCMSENIGVERAHFQKIYQQVEEREKEFNKMPKHVRDRIESTRSSCNLLEEN